MKRKLNFHALLALLGLTVLLGGGLYLLHEWQIRRGAAAWLRLADRAREEGDRDKEIDALGKYLSYTPGDGGARERYGLALAERGGPKDLLPALENLERVMREVPGRDNARRTLARVAVKIGRWGDALVHLEQLVAANPEDGELEFLCGQCREGMGRYRKQSASREGWGALEHYLRAVELPPKPLEAYVRLASLYRRRLDEPARADAVMDALVADKRSAEAHLARARYLRDRSAQEESRADARRPSAEVQVALLVGAGPNLAAALPWLFLKTYDSPLLRKAEQDLTEARRLAPDDVAVLLESAALAGAQGRPGAARAFAERGLKLDPKQPRLYLVLADLEARLGAPDKARACLERGLAALPEQTELLYALCDSLVRAGRHDDARKVMAQLAAKGFNPALLEVEEARVHVADREWLKAIRALEHALPGLARAPLLAQQEAALLLGRCYEEVGDADRQYTAYGQAGANDPSSPLWVEANAGMGRALAAMNQGDRALEIFRRLVPRAPAARLMVARLLITRNLGLPPAQREWDEVERTLDAAERQLPKSAELVLLRAQVLSAREQPEPARKLLLRALDEDPDRVPYWIALAGIAERYPEPQTAVQVLDKAQARVGDRLELRLARAAYWGRQDKARAVRALDELARGMDKFKAAEQTRLRRALAEAYAQAGATAEARGVYAQLAKDQPYDLAVKTALFDLAVRDRNEDAMGKLIGDMRAIEGDQGTLWRYGRARLLTLQASKGKGRDEAVREARRLLAEVAARRPAWYRVATCQAVIEDLDGRKTAALNHLLRAFDLGETDPEILKLALDRLTRAKRFDEANKLIAKVPERVIGREDFASGAIKVWVENGDFKRARDLAEKTVAAQPDNYRHHLWLGQVLWAMKKLPEAEASLRKAVELADRAHEPAPELRVALIQYLTANGEKDKAAAAVEEAKEKLSRDKDAAALAQCYEIVGRLNDARKLYQERLKAKPNDVVLLRGAALLELRFGNGKGAEQYLEEIEKQSATAPEEAGEARRLRTVLKAMAGDYEQAGRLIAALSRDGAPGRPPAEETVEDLRAKVLMLALRGRRPDRQEAVRLLETIRQRQVVLSPDEQLLLARLYESLGEREWPKARTEATSLLDRQGGDLRYQAYFALALLRHGETDAAAPWVERMEKQPDEVRKKSFVITEARARLWHAQGKDGDAAKLLLGHAERTKEHAGAVARLLEEFGQVRDAEKVYRQPYEQTKGNDHAAAGLILAQFLARHGRLDEALNLCDDAWGAEVPREAVAQVYVFVLYGGKAGPRQCDRVAQAIDDALKKAEREKKPTTGLLIALAALRNLQGRYDQRRYREAMECYRKVIDQDNRNVEWNIIARNNLAFLLCCSNKDKAEEARRLLEQAINLKGPLPDLLDTRGVIYLALGKPSRALADLQEANAEREEASTWFHLARAYLETEDRRSALDAWKQAVKRGLTEQSVHPLEREAYQKLERDLGRQKEAVSRPGEPAG